MRLRPVVAFSLVLTGFLVLPAHAGCSVSGSTGTDPGRAAIGAEIDKAAARRKVPPYVLKAIAWHESSWRQFDSGGRVVLSGACAIGVMQVLPAGWDARRLATDYRYNVDAGAQMLAAKMSASSANVPSGIGPDDRRVAENWYRATYRYNGAGYAAMRYADTVFATVAAPPADIRRWMPPVGITNPRNVVSGYTPTSGHGYVAHLDGTWTSTLGTFHHGVVRGDYLAGTPRARAGTGLEGDEETYTVFAARNLGWVPWSTSAVSLSTYPLGRASRLHHPGWLTRTRPVRVGRTTPPGAEGTFTFRVRAKDPASKVTVAEAFVPVVGAVSMRAHAAASWTLYPAKAPTAAITSAPEYVTDASTTSSAPVRLSYADPSPGSGVSYVQVARRAPGATSWTTTKVTTTSVRLALSGAGAHYVRVRAVDRAHHAGAWSATRRVVVPRDNTDAVLAFSGDWSAPNVSGSWLGSLATAPAGASVTTSVDGTSYALIGTRGPGLAPLTVYLDDVLVGVVDTTADTTAQRQVLWESALPAGDHVLRVVVGDATRPPAQPAEADSPPPAAFLDAIAVA